MDGFSSNGTRTLGVTATGNDKETTPGNLYFYRPGVTANVDYERYLHRLDHDPLDNMANLDPTLPNNPGGNDPLVMKQDLNVGQDYAVRVQELKGSIKGIIADDNIKVRLDVWGLKKEGTRQTNLTAMCYNRNVLGSRHLPPDHLGLGGADLGTFTGGKVPRPQPVAADQLDHHGNQARRRGPPGRPLHRRILPAHAGLHGRRPDGIPLLQRDRNTHLQCDHLEQSAVESSQRRPVPTGVVPDSYTEMDQLKISGDLTENTKAYAFLMVGHTVNREIDMTRWFNNMDVRLTNTSIENVTLTGLRQDFQRRRADAEPGERDGLGNLQQYRARPRPTSSPTLVHPINYHKSTAGLKGTWRPGGYGFDRGRAGDRRRLRVRRSGAGKRDLRIRHRRR